MRTVRSSKRWSAPGSIVAWYKGWTTHPAKEDAREAADADVDGRSPPYSRSPSPVVQCECGLSTLAAVPTGADHSTECLRAENRRLRRMLLEERARRMRAEEQVAWRTRDQETADERRGEASEEKVAAAVAAACPSPVVDGRSFFPLPRTIPILSPRIVGSSDVPITNVPARRFHSAPSAFSSSDSAAFRLFRDAEDEEEESGATHTDWRMDPPQSQYHAWIMDQPRS